MRGLERFRTLTSYSPPKRRASWMRHPLVLILGLGAVGLGGCKPVGKLVLSDASQLGVPTFSSSPVPLQSKLTFAGISSISNITASSLTLNWVNVAGASSYAVYNTTSGTPVYLGAVLAPNHAYTVTGLSISTYYTFSVDLIDTNGLVASSPQATGVTTADTTTVPGISYSSPNATYVLGAGITPNTALSTDGTASQFTVTPALPSGLSLDPNTGQITGTPISLSASQTYTVSALIMGASVTASLDFIVGFAGISSITNITGNSLQLNWLNPPGANPAPASYNVIDTATNSIVQSVSAPATNTVISGLGPGTSHTYEVRMIDTSGAIDQNTVTQSATLLSTAPPSALSYPNSSPSYTLGSAASPNPPTNSGGAATSYSITPSLPAGLSFASATGEISGTPTQLSPTTSYTVNASNAGGSTSTTLNLSVNFAGITGITGVTGSSMQLNWALPSGASPGPGSFSIFEVSPQSQFVRSVSGTSVSTVMTGLSPATSYTYTVRMVDASGTADQNTITQSATTVSTAPPSALSFSTPNPSYTLGVAIVANTPTSSGGAVSSYSINTALPAGLSFSTSTGQITGTPTQLSQSAPYTITATNAGGTATTTLQLGVNFTGISSITNVTGSSMQLNWVLPTGANPGPGSFSIFQTAPSFAFIQSASATATSSVVSGLSAGTTYSYEVQMVDTSGVSDQNSVTHSATTNATAPPSGLTYATPNPNYTLGNAISSNIPTQSGGAVASYSVSPALPAGLTISAGNGQISGTPTRLAKTANYTVTATNAGGSTTTTLTLSVNFAGINSISNVTGSTMQLNWALPVGASPSPGSFQIFEVTPTYQLVQTVGGSSTSVMLSNLTPATSYSYTVYMVDTTGQADQNTVTQSATTLATTPPSNLSYSVPSPTYTLGSAISANQPTSSGGASTSYTISPALPAGLSLSTTTGQITGTPTQLAQLATYTVTASNAGGSTTTALNLTVNFTGISTITNVTGSSMKLNWVLPTGANPAPGSFLIFETSPSSQLVQSVAGSSTSVVITGLTPNTAYTYDVRMTDTSGTTDQNVVTQSATTLSTAPPSGLSYATPSPSYTLGSAISTNSPSSGGSSVSSYSVSPNLPGGLSLNSTTGQMTGTPTALATTTPYTITATNAGGATTTVVTLAVNYAGISSISNVTGSSVQLNWTNPSGANPAAASFSIYNTTSGSAVFVESVAAPATYAVISGLTAGTSYKFRVHMVDITGTADANTVDASTTTNATAPPTSLSYTTNHPIYVLNTPITTNSPTSSGGSVSSYTITPALPSGLSFSTSSGQITGTPTQLSRANSYTVTATNAGGATTCAINLTVNFAGITNITNITGSSMQVNWASPTGASPGPASYQVIDTSSGSILQSVSAPATYATVNGLAAGSSHTYEVHMTDTSGVTDQNVVTQTATTLSTAPPMNLTYSQNTPVYVLSSPISANNPSSTGGAVASYTISPSLPAGLNFNAGTGQITGTPTQLSNLNSYTVTAANAGGSTTATLGLTVNFAGITSITPVGPNLLQVNWVIPGIANPGPSDFLIYNAANSPPSYLGTAPATATSFAVSGLTAGGSYQYLVRMVDTSGVTDTNLVSLSVTTPTTSATFQGWSNVKALGLSVPAPQATDLSTVPANVTLSWNAVSTSGSVSSYTIYRGTASGGETYGVPLATGISNSSLSYTDTTISPGVTYYYTIAPVIAGVTTELNPGVDNEITIITPPNSMALIHPWIANQEVCGLMGRLIDRSNNYRCIYTGPDNVNGYYNNTQAYFVDVNTLGCAYSLAPACGGADCIGTSGAPSNSLGTSGNVYYDRSATVCYYNNAGSWVNALSMPSTYATSFSNVAGLAPIAALTQNQGDLACQSFSVGGYTPTKRILRHREQIIAGSWSPQLTDSQITNLENGMNLYSTFACNSNSGSGLTYSNATIPSDLNTLPATSSSGFATVRGGSTATTNCVSRYGVRDYVGNMWEWSSDQLGTCNATANTCQGSTSTLDTGNTDWNGFNFDGTIGPGGTTDSYGGAYSSETVGSSSYNSWQVVLGLPMVSSAPTTWDYIAIGTGSGQFNSAHFHNNYLYLYPGNTNPAPVARGALGGGAFDTQTLGGLYTLYVAEPPTAQHPGWGVRCMLPLN